MNPVKAQRQKMRLTIDQLCHQADVSKSLVIKNEQGAYPEPSVTIVDFFYNNSDEFDKVEFTTAYYEWQSWQRKRNYGLLTPDFPLESYLKGLPVGEAMVAPYKHPFLYWRQASFTHPNLNAISKGFCIHQGLLFKFESQSHLVNSVPQPIRSALLEAQYTERSLDRLELAYSEWKRYMRNLSQQRTHGGPNGPADTTP